jgi:hypothetical protein
MCWLPRAIQPPKWTLHLRLHPESYVRPAPHSRILTSQLEHRLRDIVKTAAISTNINYTQDQLLGVQRYFGKSLLSWCCTVHDENR